MSTSNQKFYGFPVPDLGVFPPPIIAARAPTTADIAFPIGQIWVFSGTNGYILLGVSAGVADWQILAATSGAVDTLTGDTGTATPVVNNIQIAGTANQVTTAASGAVVTLSLPAAITAPGSLTVTSGFTVSAGTTAITGTTNINTTGAAVTSIGFGGTGAVRIGNVTGNTAVTGSLTASTTLTATLGNITATNGNLSLGTAGNKLAIATGSNASLGTSGALSSGTVTVATTAVTASSKIFLTRAVAGGTLGNLSIGTISAAVSFTITSDNAADTSTINWLIIN